MGLLDDIKNQVKKSGTNKGKFLYFRSGTKARIRFLVDMEDGLKFSFHDSFEKSINVPCQELFGRDCPYCGDESLRTRDQYCWSVWDYESNSVKLLMAAVNNCSPIPALVAMYDTYGTLKDRDYVITKQGAQQNTTFSVVPMDKVKFRNEKAKPFNESQILKMLDKAFPCDDADADDEESPKQKTKSSKKDEIDVDEDETDYYNMTARELYNLCIEQEIDVKPKKNQEYYINMLESKAKGREKLSDDWDE